MSTSTHCAEAVIVSPVNKNTDITTMDTILLLSKETFAPLNLTHFGSISNMSCLSDKTVKKLQLLQIVNKKGKEGKVMWLLAPHTNYFLSIYFLRSAIAARAPAMIAITTPTMPIASAVVLELETVVTIVVPG